LLMLTPTSFLSWQQAETIGERLLEYLVPKNRQDTQIFLTTRHLHAGAGARDTLVFQCRQARATPRWGTRTRHCVPMFWFQCRQARARRSPGGARCKDGALGLSITNLPPWASRLRMAGPSQPRSASRSASPTINRLRDNETGGLDKAQQVLSVVLPAEEDATLPLYPCEEAFDKPTPHVAA